MKVLVVGAGGMVGQAVVKTCYLSDDEVIAFNHHELNIADAQEVSAALESVRPEFVINCAAWTDVEACEFNPLEANRVNAIGPENLARSSRQVGAGLITISTDYVFDGSKEGFYTQRDNPNPQSVYAVTKLKGEHCAQKANARCIVVRTGFIFGVGGRNFLSRLLQRARSGESIAAIVDAWGTPTCSLDLAKRLRQLALIDLPGVYHVVNSGAGASYAEFTEVALEAAGFSNPIVDFVSESSLKRRAPRPRNSRLRCLISEAIGLEALRDWREAVKDFAILQADSGFATASETRE